jgi:hypothetical protein
LQVFGNWVGCVNDFQNEIAFLDTVYCFRCIYNYTGNCNIYFLF